MSELFDGLFAAGPVGPLTDDAAWLGAMLEFEAALGGALADAGLIDRTDADTIAAECRSERYDVAEIGAAAVGIGNPAGPLVRALTARVGEVAARSVHQGATSQDVMDTAAMLIARRAVGALLGDLGATADRLAELAGRHRDTVQAGRSLLQQGPPVTFGLTVAGWLTGLDAAADRLRWLRFAVQFGGAVGTLASLGAQGPAVRTALARRLGLPEPALPWHTERTRIAELASALGEVCGVAGKICGDVTLLAMTELAEVTEEGPAGSGGSSTMPQKRNPVAAVTALAAARQAPGLVAGLLGAMVQEHQRAAGAWQAEWRQLTDLLRLTGAAVHWLRTCVERLRVHEDAMRANLDHTGGLAVAERVTSELAPVIGRLRAHDAVTAACRRAAAGEGTLAEVLAADPLLGAHLDRERIAVLLDPTGYLGSAATFVDAALAAHRERTG